ncbi:MAG TPA: glycoside hydrolase family 16 protein [Brevundimonas sp.]|jgi:beta-glucanase (GH16 family)|uniref:glycoside hydrolase family 16 protein n=1 Tax=Brevundimonas sp. TaxID=1871086 RepID=UPI002E11AED9|nr:glycoside hydrolase family 16 protein [Brevundimonas sp.]
MRASLLALTTLLLAAPAMAQTPLPGHRLVWSDEFDRDGLPDPARWRYDTHANRSGWYNDERQYYAADRPENARVENGRLIIEARRERLTEAADFGGQAYTSARMISREAWTYGVVQVRARLPCGGGTWPAIWMLPKDLTSWPGDGEIDIMEHVGNRPGVVLGTVHTGAYNHVAGTQRGGETVVEDACDAFHVYAATWTADGIDFAIDGRPFYRFDNDGAGDRATWPFDRPFELILNVAIGGGLGGAVDDSAFPQWLEVDWVRVWQAD